MLKFNLNRRPPSIDPFNELLEMCVLLVKQPPVIPEFWAQETILFNGDKPHCLFFTDCAGFLRASVRALKQPHVVYQCDSDSREGKICVAPQHLPMILWIPTWKAMPQHKYIHCVAWQCCWIFVRCSSNCFVWGIFHWRLMSYLNCDARTHNPQFDVKKHILKEHGNTRS